MTEFVEKLVCAIQLNPIGTVPIAAFVEAVREPPLPEFIDIN
jgi:hypothetical protein